MLARKLGAAAAAVAAVVSGLVVGGSSVANAVPGACPDLYVVAIPGTWETSDHSAARPGMLTNVTAGLPGNVRSDYVSYAATAFPWEGDVYGRSKNQAVDNARGMVGAMAQQCGNTKIALIGYSQGADAAGDLAAEIGTGIGVIPPNRLVAVGLISDPRRSQTDALIGAPVAGNGASGPRPGGFGFVTPAVRTFCAVGDLYCATSKDDFVMRFAGFLAQTSDPNPAKFGLYQQEGAAIFGDLMTSGGIPLLQSQLSDQANKDRVNQLEKFYQSQIHTDYANYPVDGAGNSATSWVRNWLRDLA
ncbi:cutinase family protein [Antrihabitans cavernicola]|uniref:Cutinase family protein n=1 Tax=Antrihabitans cavernicola TaxID=2495913 RepID=A0A5A7SKR8_9NOCA|nr:cutinase family protein [Spelaeibacter cavernicola]KAA0024821.1 cutinase family protein [Spelaeibacter cavernicola]